MSDNVFIKIIVVGEQNVGKTCILARYSRDQFDTTCPPTLGMDFQSKLLEYKGKTIRLQLWDIAGQERYNSVSKLYVRGAYGALIVADVKEEESLQNTLKWKKMIEDSCDQKNGKPIPMILVQNKVDELKGVGQIQDFQKESYLKSFAQQNGFNGALQVSAKDNTNIPDIFNMLIDEIISQGFLSNFDTSVPDKNYNRPSNNDNYSNPQKITSQQLQKNAQSSSSSKKNSGGCC
ncbi:Rab-family small GTPase (macronuclear) [Tetrahymena thermophila SB210]|uniref:Rab-family small GTPase n=2 Tax=Tetrahymena thermophila TaxID=5911 RepID=Q24E55_TETTS|nr:Rab-family small GTPase [Tetrahymena thermophila SB210]EAS06046.1 Rab-family small GTPase [Tetrahymena thermophila SB210]BAJ21307.1 Rab-family small GTPase RabX12 [Tetrahymena thermophila]|eukprot:XP_001026291.1 Rab-family small GTPase [Tetrahymena thermophila SB210]